MEELDVLFNLRIPYRSSSVLEGYTYPYQFYLSNFNSIPEVEQLGEESLMVGTWPLIIVREHGISSYIPPPRFAKPYQLITLPKGVKINQVAIYLRRNNLKIGYPINMLN